MTHKLIAISDPRVLLALVIGDVVGEWRGRRHSASTAATLAGVAGAAVFGLVHAEGHSNVHWLGVLGLAALVTAAIVAGVRGREQPLDSVGRWVP